VESDTTTSAGNSSNAYRTIQCIPPSLYSISHATPRHFIMPMLLNAAFITAVKGRNILQTCQYEGRSIPAAGNGSPSGTG